MIRRYVSVALSMFLLANTPLVYAIDLPTTEETILQEQTIVITEIFANAPGSSESGHEFVELHNTTENNITLTGFILSREGNDSVLALDTITLIAGEYLAVITPFSLLNSGGTVYLHYPVVDGNEFIIEQPYIGTGESNSWSLVGDLWQASSPTPSEANPAPINPQDEPEGEPDEVAAVSCAASTLFINEIVANPAGSDTSGGEFVELVNEGTLLQSLEGCLLFTNKGVELLLGDAMIEPGAFYVIELSNGLLNGGGSVKFLTATEELEVDYPSLGDDESWSLINGVWEISSIATPGTANQSSPEEPELQQVEDAPTPCPEGKFRNPETNRCKTIISEASSLLPCQPGSVRNPETNRCRKTTTSLISSLKACDAGQERNPETNRCRKIQSVNNEQKPCPEGEERNPETNRCRKVSAVLATADFNIPSQSAGIHSGVFTFMTVLALLYGVYEYRLDFVNSSQLLKKRIIDFKTKRA